MSGPAVHVDFETASVADLQKVGVYRYAEDPTTRIWLMSWGLDGGPSGMWLPGAPAPQPLLDHVARGGRFVAHNAPFERLIWNTCLRGKYEPRWPRLEIEQCDCTMARALAIHLPGDLDTLGQVLGLTQTKDMEGYSLMRKMMRPRKVYADGRIEWWDEPANVMRLGEYCEVDRNVETLAEAKLPRLSPEERALWELDQRVNDRGVAVDVETIESIIAVLEVAKERANQRMRELTGGAVEKITEALRIVNWLGERGIKTDTIAKTAHRDLIVIAETFGDETAREVIELRAEAARGATGKFQAIMNFVCADGRVRGLFKYHGASTGRWAGGGPQVHNLARFEDSKQDYFPDVTASIDIIRRFQDVRAY